MEHAAKQGEQGETNKSSKLTDLIRTNPKSSMILISNNARPSNIEIDKYDELRYGEIFVGKRIDSCYAFNKLYEFFSFGEYICDDCGDYSYTVFAYKAGRWCFSCCEPWTYVSYRKLIEKAVRQAQNNTQSVNAAYLVHIESEIAALHDISDVAIEMKKYIYIKTIRAIIRSTNRNPVPYIYYMLMRVDVILMINFQSYAYLVEKIYNIDIWSAYDRSIIVEDYAGIIFRFNMPNLAEPVHIVIDKNDFAYDSNAKRIHLIFNNNRVDVNSKYFYKSICTIIDKTASCVSGCTKNEIIKNMITYVMYDDIGRKMKGNPIKKIRRYVQAKRPFFKPSAYDVFDELPSFDYDTHYIDTLRKLDTYMAIHHSTAFRICMVCKTQVKVHMYGYCTSCIPFYTNHIRTVHNIDDILESITLENAEQHTLLIRRIAGNNWKLCTDPVWNTYFYLKKFEQNYLLAYVVLYIKKHVTCQEISPLKVHYFDAMNRNRKMNWNMYFLLLLIEFDFASRYDIRSFFIEKHVTRRKRADFGGDVRIFGKSVPFLIEVNDSSHITMSDTIRSDEIKKSHADKMGIRIFNIDLTTVNREAYTYERMKAKYVEFDAEFAKFVADYRYAYPTDV